MPFVKGQSGNPKGRPAGFIRLERELREAHGPKLMSVMDKLYDMAMGNCEGERATKDGGIVTVKLDPDANAAKLYFDRILGPVRERMPALDDLSDGELEARVCEYLGITTEQLEAIRGPVGAVQ